jgi:hypothetical protein
MKKKWEDPEYRKFMAEITSNNFKKSWENPEYRSKMVELSREIMNKNWDNEEFRDRAAQRMKNLSIEWWKDEEYRNSQIIRQRERMKELWKDDKFRERSSDSSKRRWEGSEYRDHISSCVKARMNTPESKVRSSEQFSKNMKKKWQEEEFRTRMAEKVRARMTPEFRAYLQEKKNEKFDGGSASALGVSIDTIKLAIVNNNNIDSIFKLRSHFKCSFSLIRRVLTKSGIPKSEQADWIKSYKNHSVIFVTTCEPSYLFSLNFDSSTKFAVSDVFVIN